MDTRIEMISGHIRDIPNFPKPGILFRDITPLLAAPEAFRAVVDLLAEHYLQQDLQGVVAVESRGFIFGGALAYKLGVPMILVRKPGKLPYRTHSVEYALEYGTDKLEMHQETIRPGQRLLIMDDLLATGGTAAATVRLAEGQGGKVIECGFVIELELLKGRAKLAPTPCFSLLRY